MAKRKFPYKVYILDALLIDDAKRYWEIHYKVIVWLKEYIGVRGTDWWCSSSSIYFLMREEDAMAFKLRWS